MQVLFRCRCIHASLLFLCLKSRLNKLTWGSRLEIEGV